MLAELVYVGWSQAGINLCWLVPCLLASAGTLLSARVVVASMC
jgi:hypothetical protein